MEQEETPKEDGTHRSAKITPKSRHCLQLLEGKYGKRDEILRDNLNGKLRIVENKKQAERDSEDDEDADDEEEKCRKKSEKHMLPPRKMEDTRRFRQIPQTT